MKAENEESSEEIEENEKNKKNCLLVHKDKNTFLYLGCCHINIGLVFTYLYILSASGLNIINRIIFRNYKFTFNFTYSFLQQLISLFLFTVIGTKNEHFKKSVGDLNFSEFSKFKCYYISFALISILNILIGFYGMQIVNNVPMFLSLRKLTTVMLFFIDFFFDKKKISFITMLCIFLMSGGSILVGLETFTSDYTGYIIVIINNAITITYSKLTEIFKRHTGVSNLKLLVFNTYLAIPMLIIGIIVCQEYVKVYDYFTLKDKNIIIHGSFYGLAFFLSISCALCAILSSSFFLSNEKTSSLMTNLIVNTKTVFISIFLFIYDSKRNTLTPLILTGLVMTTFGAIFINAESLCKNLHFNINKKNKKDEKPEETELIDVKDDSKEKDNNNK